VKSKRSPGEHSHADQRNFTIDDYLRMVRDGESKFSIAEAAKVMGVSRAYLYRAMIFASIPADEFEAVLDDMSAKGRPVTSTAIADEIKRRTGRAKTYVEKCPHCGGELRRRSR